MIEWDAQAIAERSGARVLASGRSRGGPHGVSIDSRSLLPGELFVGLRGERADGGRYAAQALARGAWGALVAPEHARELSERGEFAGPAAGQPGAVLAHPDPLAALQALARRWRGELGAEVVAITGSVGKTSTKEILAALLARTRVCRASPANFNTEIGVPLAILGAPRGTEVLVLELAMRGPGQIAELTAIADPDVGLIVNVGPVHLGLLGSREAVAAAKAELIAGLRGDATAVLPAHEPLLAPHRRPELRTITFGRGGDLEIEGVSADGEVSIGAPGGTLRLRPSLVQEHNLKNLLAAVAVAHALGERPAGEVAATLSPLRGERVALAGGAVLINDCYNANPMSVRAALDELARSAGGRRVAVLGDMLELGPEAGALHREIGEYAQEAGVDVLVTVGELAAEMTETFPGEAHRVAGADAAAELLAGMLREGDTVLVKGSRALALERIAEALPGAQAGVVADTAGSPSPPRHTGGARGARERHAGASTRVGGPA
jgi:UDP-N-acetylmuramoyl-tripeptide--D-alanyl-D-alanine ligase